MKGKLAILIVVFLCAPLVASAQQAALQVGAAADAKEMAEEQQQLTRERMEKAQEREAQFEVQGKTPGRPQEAQLEVQGKIPGQLRLAIPEMVRTVFGGDPYCDRVTEPERKLTCLEKMVEKIDITTKYICDKRNGLTRCHGGIGGHCGVLKPLSPPRGIEEQIQFHVREVKRAIDNFVREDERFSEDLAPLCED